MITYLNTLPLDAQKSRKSTEFEVQLGILFAEP